LFATFNPFALLLEWLGKQVGIWSVLYYEFVALANIIKILIRVDVRDAGVIALTFLAHQA